MPVKLILNTENRKLLGCAVTYVAQQSCPQECLFLNQGCYAEYGPMLWTVTSKLNQEAKGLGIMDLARREAELIAWLSRDPRARDRPLRLHGVGDCASDGAAKIVARASEYWITKNKAPVWGYTHAWKNVKRESWRNVSILASVENPIDLALAWRRDYAAALVVPEFPNGPKAFTQWIKKPGKKSQSFKVIPCPEQTLGIGCRDCKLCFKDQWLHENRIVIGFTPHGVGQKKVRQTLVSIQEKNSSNTP